MKFISLLSLLMLFNLYAESEVRLNQALCNGATVLVIPKIIQLPEGYAIQIVSTSSNNQPYILVKDKNGQYEAEIINQGKSKNKFFGYVLLNKPNILSLQIDGCEIKLEMKL